MLMHHLNGRGAKDQTRSDALDRLSLSLDEKQQYKCAGLVEAEIQGLLSSHGADVETDVDPPQESSLRQGRGGTQSGLLF